MEIRALEKRIAELEQQILDLEEIIEDRAKLLQAAEEATGVQLTLLPSDLTLVQADEITDQIKRICRNI